MSHVRTQIRTAVAAALEGIAEVSVSRVYPLQDLPAILVSTNAETFAQAGEGPMGLVQRSLEVGVEVIAAGDRVDEQIDALLVQVEEALHGSTLGGLVVSLTPQQIEFELLGDGDRPIGRARLIIEAVYRTSYTDPETAI